jgi:hypothetical protein
VLRLSIRTSVISTTSSFEEFPFKRFKDVSIFRRWFFNSPENATYYGIKNPNRLFTIRLGFSGGENTTTASFRFIKLMIRFVYFLPKSGRVANGRMPYQAKLFPHLWTAKAESSLLKWQTKSFFHRSGDLLALNS